MFRGIAVPSEVKIPTTDLVVVEHAAEPHGETVEQAILGGVLLTAYWGDVLRDHGFNPSFMHGIYDVDACGVDVFDIPAMVEDTSERHSGRLALEEQLGFDGGEHRVFGLPVDLAPQFQAVAGFYDLDIRKIFSTAISLRLLILDRQTRGDSYGLTPDGENWFWISVTHDDL